MKCLFSYPAAWRGLALLTLLTPVGGCTLAAQQKLTGQLLRAIEVMDQDRRLVQSQRDQLGGVRRRMLDEGFDQDVRTRENLSGPWVIEHRQAYAAALDALYDESRRLLRADALADSNAAQAKAAIGVLSQLQQSTSSLIKLIPSPLAVEKK